MCGKELQKTDDCNVFWWTSFLSKGKQLIIETELVRLVKKRGGLRIKKEKLKKGSKTWQKIEKEIEDLTIEINKLQDPR